MWEQRSRRSVLVSIGGSGVVGAAGCLGGGESVSVLAAGSLAVVLEDAIGRRYEEESGIAMHGEYYGANAAVRMILDGQKQPDVAISADVELLRDRLYPEHATWDVVFGANEVGLAYDPGTDLGGRLEAGEPWYDVVRDADDGDVAISDPDLDPLGYRAIHALDLAEAYYDLEGFRETVLESAYREPEEPQLLAGLETGARAIAVTYRNMAVDHDLPFYELPAELNFAAPAHADHYASVSYTTDDGYTARGSPMLYNVTVLESADEPGSGREFVRVLLESADLFEEHGVAVPDEVPVTHGELPEGVRWV